jgi:hypothetical protein
MKQDTLIEGSAAIDGVPDDIDVLDWVQGKRMRDISENREVLLELALESGDYRGSVIDGLLTLYHETLKAGMDSFGIENVKYMPVVLRDQESGEKENRYFLANIIGLLDCVDMSKSKTKPWVTGIGFDFQSMVIDESKTNGAKIFRLKEDPTKVIINEELKQYFDDTDLLVGVELIKTEDYSDW